VDAAIILGAQANREVKSLETFQMENMREAGDIEQDANIVIGVWDKEAADLYQLQ
jgi:replicative DNA helicase